MQTTLFKLFKRHFHKNIFQEAFFEKSILNESIFRYFFINLHFLKNLFLKGGSCKGAFLFFWKGIFVTRLFFIKINVHWEQSTFCKGTYHARYFCYQALFVKAHFLPGTFWKAKFFTRNFSEVHFLPVTFRVVCFTR